MWWKVYKIWGGVGALKATIIEFINTFKICKTNA